MASMYPEHFGTPGCEHEFDPECARCGFGRQVLDAIPDNWAKVDGEWVRLRPVNVRRDAGRRTYEEA